MFTITITEHPAPQAQAAGLDTLPMSIERLKMTLDTVDINAVIATLTKKPRARRKDAGVKRGE